MADAWYRKGPTDTSSTRTSDVGVAVAVANVLIPDVPMYNSSVQMRLVMTCIEQDRHTIVVIIVISIIIINNNKTKQK